MAPGTEHEEKVRLMLLAGKVKKLRSQLGLTQEQFASLIGVTFSTVNRWERGRSKPSPLALRRINELLNQSDKN